MELAGRNALITGGARRVGRALALALAGAGANVFIHYRRSAESAEQTAAEARALGPLAACGSADLGDPSSTHALLAQARAELGSISVLVNSASGFSADTLTDVTLAGFRSALDLTLTAPVMLTQAFAAALPYSFDGAVLNITDARTRTPYRNHFSYVVAKGALDAFTRTAAVQLAPRIRVNAVALGVILPPPGADATYAERLAVELPLERVGGTGPVAAAAIALLTNDFVTGEIVRVDGGGHLI
ncbi:MAG: SDR family oxidoreductase [Actinomycetia bacterium]|nr:SDR family oxidoreductase [Actinomycetes bacterium]